MKKVLALFLVAAIAGGSVKAQEIPERKAEHPRMMHKKHGHHGMDMKALNLTEDQKAKFKTQQESFKKQMEELKKNDNITVKEWKSRMESLRKENKTQFEKILTSEQKATMEKMKAERKAKMESMGKDRDEKMDGTKRTGNENFGKERGERMKAELGLSADQSAKLDATRKETQEKIKSIRENNSLSEDQKKDQVKEVMKGNKEKLKFILTEEQMKKMDEMRKHKPHGDKEKRTDGNKTI